MALEKILDLVTIFDMAIERKRLEYSEVADGFAKYYVQDIPEVDKIAIGDLSFLGSVGGGRAIVVIEYELLRHNYSSPSYIGLDKIRSIDFGEGYRKYLQCVRRNERRKVAIIRDKKAYEVINFPYLIAGYCLNGRTPELFLFEKPGA